LNHETVTNGNLASGVFPTAVLLEDISSNGELAASSVPRRYAVLAERVMVAAGAEEPVEWGCRHKDMMDLSDFASMGKILANVVTKLRKEQLT